MPKPHTLPLVLSVGAPHGFLVIFHCPDVRHSSEVVGCIEVVGVLCHMSNNEEVRHHAHNGRDDINPGKSILDIFTSSFVLGNHFQAIRSVSRKL